MATKKKDGKKKSGKPLIIVESPAKARTIKKYLGSDYMIEASVGHVRDLPAGAAEIPAKLKKEKWARLGIDIDNGFVPIYVVPSNKREQLSKLKKLVKEASEIYLATDEDREGESISWHLREVLSPKVEVKRLVFHEITKPAILAALDNPRSINDDLVEAQETRRLVDRLYGYLVSPLLWKKVRPKLSAGRVQSVAVRLICEREEDRIRFVRADHWDLQGSFQAEVGKPFEAKLIAVGDQKVAIGKDFDPDTGKLKDADPKPLHLDKNAAHDLLKKLQGKDACVEKVEQKPFRERPAPPFTTSTLQQEAGRKLGFTAQRTMRASQRLYENGYITYMRTDSTTLSQEAVGAARSLIEKAFGREFLPGEPRLYATKVKNAQEAHEAIRPAGSSFVDYQKLGADMKGDECKVYELIYKRTVASQMKDATGQRTTLHLRIDDAFFRASGKTIEFHGFRKAYVEEKDDRASSQGDEERLLPSVEKDDLVKTVGLEADSHTTQPPARLTEASLVRELEARGIGRPSTYASIIETIQQRQYVFKKGSALVPTFTAMAVVKLLDQHLPHLVDYGFTARMENDLDEISNGRQKRLDYLRSFYSGNGQPGLKDEVSKAEGDADARTICTRSIGEGHGGEAVAVRVGRYGPYLQSGESRAQLPTELPPDELTLERALTILEDAGRFPRELGTDPQTDLTVYVNHGRFGHYFQLGTIEDLKEKPKMASLLDGMDPETITLDEALAVLSLPRELGTRATSGDDEEASGEESIFALNGRYGPYIKAGKETRSIPADKSPLTITLAEALALLAQPKAHGRRGRVAKVLKELGKHPDSGEEIRILDGRYGPYTTDGSTNASVPKGEKVDDITLERALELIEARAARGPARKKKAAKKKGSKSTKKKAAKKKGSKSTKKKAAKKKGGDGKA